jgi:hypothetical protein
MKNKIIQIGAFMDSLTYVLLMVYAIYNYQDVYKMCALILTALIFQGCCLFFERMQNEKLD